MLYFMYLIMLEHLNKPHVFQFQRYTKFCWKYKKVIAEFYPTVMEIVLICLKVFLKANEINE